MNEVYTLEKLFGRFPGGIRVPRIQRGYVQGRENSKGEAIRAEFVPALVAATFGGKPLSLDFLYGVAAEGSRVADRALLPLDGQQRLTTLALLAWLCGKWRKEWRFAYESRRIPELFMEGLLNSTPPKTGKSSEMARKAGWFLPVWENDPTVAGMLRMLDALDAEIGGRDRTAADFGTITFLLHGIDGTVETFDHIFRKMNARGKELSPWENLKAMLDKHIPQTLADEWREKVDGDWPEEIWSHVGGNVVALDKAMEKVLRMAYARFASFGAQSATFWQMEGTIAGVGKEGFDELKRETFYRLAALYFDALPSVAGCWTEERGKNALWGGTGDETAFWVWLSNDRSSSASDLLRMAFLAEKADTPEARRRRRVLLNLLDYTEIDNNGDDLQKKGLAFLADGDLCHLVGFNKEQLADEKWKARFDGREIVEIERHPLVYWGSTAFLGEKRPADMSAALTTVQEAIQTDRKGFFLSLLGLSGKCDSTLPCRSIMIPEKEKDWAKECFSARRLFLREGVEAWLAGKRYNADSGSSAWLTHLSDLWDTVEKNGLKWIRTKDAGWLFCVKNTNLTDEAIRLAWSPEERNRLELLVGIQTTDTGIPYIAWRDLPYDGFMKAKDGDWYYNVKQESWRVFGELPRRAKDADGTFVVISSSSE